MNIVSDIVEWRKIRAGLKGTLGFVPTMGHLHSGHISLCQRAGRENDTAVASIFVNPTQFNQASDFEAYQRTLDADCVLLKAAGVKYVFTPGKEALYPDNYEVQLSETVLVRELEGEFRPGHFTGMMTVVLKLLNIIQPTRAYFGEKDFQQLLLVQKMASAMFLPVEIVACETVREASGLAMSSRNTRLDPVQRSHAAKLAQCLMSTLDDEAVKQELEKNGFRPEYVASRWGRRLAAVWLGDVRLIDNVPLTKENQNAAVSGRR